MIPPYLCPCISRLKRLNPIKLVWSERIVDMLRCKIVMNHWIFIGRTDDEAEVPILWPPDMNNRLIRKDPDEGKDWRQEEKGTTEDEMFGWYHRLNGHEFEQAWGVGDGQRPGMLQSMGLQRVRHAWATELNWDNLKIICATLSYLKGTTTLVSETSFKNMS